MIEIYAVKVLKEIAEAEYEQLLTLVSENKREKVKKRKNKNSLIGTLYGEVLTQYAVRKRLDLKTQDIQFQYSEHGKPYLVGQNQVFFNVSHSGDWVVCAVGDQEVGIDIEKIRDDRIKVAKRFFTQEEYQDILNQPKDLQSDYFCKLWTLKECYVKWSGKGLTVPLDSFSFQMNGSTQMFEVRVLNQDQHKIIDGIQFRQYEVDENYRLSVCSLKEEFCNEIQVIDARRLLDVMMKEKVSE